MRERERERERERARERERERERETVCVLLHVQVGQNMTKCYWTIWSATPNFVYTTPVSAN